MALGTAIALKSSAGGSESALLFQKESLIFRKGMEISGASNTSPQTKISGLATRSRVGLSAESIVAIPSVGKATFKVDQQLQRPLPEHDDSEDYDPLRLADAAAALQSLADADCCVT